MMSSEQPSGEGEIFADWSRIREDFPVLGRTVNGKPLVYLDNAATSQKPRSVIDAMTTYYSNYNANIHRGVHTLSEEATAAFESARAKIARFINAKYTEEVIFTRGTTEALNMVAQSWGRRNLSRGSRVLLTMMEHHSNIVPWQLITREKGAELDYVGVDEEGQLVMSDYDRLITGETKVISTIHISNVLGSTNPVREIAKMARENGAISVVDAAQSAPHIPLDVQEIDCDFMAISGHKMLGPTGIGVLYGKRHLLQEMDPFLGGGDMIKEVKLREARWNDLPWKFEAGTSNIAGGIGLGAAVDYLSRVGMQRIKDRDATLVSHAMEAMKKHEDIKIYGTKDPSKRCSLVSFNLGDIHPHDVASILDGEGIAARSGHHCAQPLLEMLGVVATNRISFYLYNTEEEIDLLMQGLEKARRIFGL